MTQTQKSKNILDTLYQWGLIEYAKSVISKQTFKSGKLSFSREALFHAMYEGSNRDNFTSPIQVYEKFREEHHLSSETVKRYACESYKIISLTLELNESERIRKYDCFRETIDNVLFKRKMSEETLEGFLRSDDESFLTKLSLENKKYLQAVAQSKKLSLQTVINRIIDAERLSDS